MSTTITDLLALFGGGAAVIAAIAGFSYWLFKLFSEKWLSAKFHERLENYKHQQQKELEELRFKIPEGLRNIFCCAKCARQRRNDSGVIGPGIR
jgi:hypothetical protein